MIKETKSNLIEVLLIQSEEPKTFGSDSLGNQHRFSFANSLEEAKTHLKLREYDIIFLDLNLSDHTGLETLKNGLREAGAIPIVILISKIDEDLGIESMQYGAQDYLFKDELLSPQMVQKVVRFSIERNKNLRTLNQHENSLKLAQEIAKIGSWTWYPVRDTFVPSEAFLNVFNIKGLKNSGSFLPFLENVHPDDHLKIKRALNRHSKKLESFSLEFRFYNRMGELRHILMHGDFQEGLELAEPTYYGTGQDVTEFKTTNEDLVQKNRFLELSGEIAAIGGWEIDLKTEKVFWSKASFAIHSQPSSFDPRIENLKNLYDEKVLATIKVSYDKSVLEKKLFNIQVPYSFNGTKKLLQYIGKISYTKNGVPAKMTGIVQDISDSKRQLDKLSIRAMMLDNVGEAAMAIDKDWKIIFWNKASERLFKYKRSEVIGKSIGLFNIVNLQESELKIGFDKIKDGESVAGEYNLIDKEGREFLGWVSNAPIIDANGNMEALVAIARDISVEKKYITKLKESETRFRNLFELSPMGIGLIDFESSKWLDANNTLLKLLGYSFEELVKLTFMDITADPLKQKNSILFKKNQNRKSFGPYQKEYIKKDGSHIKVLLTGFVVIDLNGQKKIWTHVLDISELEEKTETLRLTEERFNEYVENSTDVIFSVNATGIILSVSINVINMLGYYYKEVIGMSIFDLSHPEDKEHMVESFNKSSQNLDDVGRITTRILNTHGDYIWVQAEGNMRKAPDGSIYGILMARDVTNERKSELIVREQNKILKDIAFIQSHILRRPLANILGMLNIAALKENVPKPTARLLDIVKKEAEIMDQIVAEIVEKSTEINNLSDGGE